MKTVVDVYTYREFVEYSKNREIHSNNGQSSRKGSKGFTQTESFEEAVSFAENGWDLGLEEYKIEQGVLSSGTTHLNPSLAGCMPHVQNHIMGFPQQMYDLYDEREYNLPTLDLIVPLAYSGGTNSKDALKFSVSIVKYINKMSSTHNIRLTGIFNTKQNNTDYHVIIKLKDFDERMVLNNVAFAFHPSFFRRLWFSVAESKSFLSSGYGRVQGNYDNVIREEIKTESSDKVLFFKCLKDLDKYSFKPEQVEDYIL